MAGKAFKEYYSKLAKEGALKALLCGLIAGFSTAFVTALVFWFVKPELFWTAFIAFGVVTAAVSAVFYFCRFKPTTKDIAKRVDALGLEERLITMTELEGDESFMAMKQREDAKKSLSTVSAKLLKLAVSLPLVIAVCISAVVGVGMATVTALGAEGKLKSGKDIIDDFTEEQITYFEVFYEAEGEGEIDGEMFQLVKAGEDAIGVMAVPAEGWMFVEWSDGWAEPYRQDFKVEGNMYFTALFMEAEDGDGGEGGDGGMGENEPGQPGDKDGKPGEVGQGGEGEASNGGEPGETGGSEGDAEGEDSGANSDGSGSGGQNPNEGTGKGQGAGAGGDYTSNNYVDNGKTYYGDVYAPSKEDALKNAEEDGDLTEEEKELIGNYFDMIQP